VTRALARAFPHRLFLLNPGGGLAVQALLFRVRRNKMNERIMIISDDEPNASLERALDGHGFTVTVAESANDGYERLSQSHFDLVIVDLNRPITGVGLIKRIRSNPALRRLLVLTIAEWGTGQPTMALAQGADGFEPAPVDAGRLVAAVAKLLRPNMVMTASASTTNSESDR